MTPRQSVVAFTDPLGQVTSTKTYDALNRPTQVTLPITSSPGWENQQLLRRLPIPPTGLKWKAVDELSRETITEYDSAGGEGKGTGG